MQSVSTAAQKHFYWLDLVRFLTAFLVIACHYRGMLFVEYGALPESQQNIITGVVFFFTRLGHEAVLVFFVMSGFLVGGKALERMMNGTVDLKSYSIDRFVRIALPLIASLLIVVVIDLIRQKPLSIIDLVGSLFALQGVLTSVEFNEPLWSLSYEVWFYILMGCLMCIASVKDRRPLLLSFWILIVVFIVFTKLKPLYLFIWFLGAITYVLPVPQSVKLYKVILLGLLVLCFTILLQATTASRSVNIGVLSFLNRGVMELLFAISICLFIQHVIQLQPHSVGVKINAIGTQLAAFSYTLYLVHIPIIRLMLYCGYPVSGSISVYSIVIYFIALLIVLLASYLIYLLFEKQTHRVKNFIKNRY
ncbi:MAG: acyltransferase family protein [Cytophagaceae bacterium]|jgi:peptidoglycan/LPS O-acetylase OafA/YrhL|nr:acyltransferase family protein [Cytophagaceae bacterium]